MRTPVRLTVAALAVAALVAVPVAALASSPPKGKYSCTIGGSTLFGTLYVTGSKAYRYDASDGRGKPGKYTSSGTKLTFKTGPLKGMKGRWVKTKQGPEVALRNPRDNFESIYCDK
jgi:hypothetical protein